MSNTFKIGFKPKDRNGANPSSQSSKKTEAQGRSFKTILASEWKNAKEFGSNILKSDGWGGAEWSTSKKIGVSLMTALLAMIVATAILGVLAHYGHLGHQASHAMGQVEGFMKHKFAPFFPHAAHSVGSGIYNAEVAIGSWKPQTWVPISGVVGLAIGGVLFYKAAHKIKSVAQSYCQKPRFLKSSHGKYPEATEPNGEIKQENSKPPLGEWVFIEGDKSKSDKPSPASMGYYRYEGPARQ